MEADGEKLGAISIRSQNVTSIDMLEQIASHTRACH